MKIHDSCGVVGNVTIYEVQKHVVQAVCTSVHLQADTSSHSGTSETKNNSPPKKVRQKFPRGRVLGSSMLVPEGLGSLNFLGLLGGFKGLRFGV